MSSKSSHWSNSPGNFISFTKRGLSHLSLIVRGEQLRTMLLMYRVTPRQKILDVGMSPNETLIDTNYFQKYYPYPERMTAVSVEDCSKVARNYPKIKFKKVLANKRLPFRSQSFDIVTAWATLEHVGGIQAQEYFLNELLRVGKRIFVTTPYRGSPYEPHTGLFFAQWLPLAWFRKICLWLHKDFWADEDNLNPLFVSNVKSMKLKRKVQIRIYKTFGLLPTHILISNDRVR